MSNIVDVSVFALGTLLIGAGVASKDIGWAAVSVGAILLALVVVSKLRGGVKA